MGTNKPYIYIVVESYKPKLTSGLHGDVHIRPIKGQIFPQSLHVRCSKKMSDTKLHALGTKFRIKVVLTNREGMGEFLHSDYRWPYEVINEDQ